MPSNGKGIDMSQNRARPQEYQGGERNGAGSVRPQAVDCEPPSPAELANGRGGEEIRALERVMPAQNRKSEAASAAKPRGTDGTISEGTPTQNSQTGPRTAWSKGCKRLNHYPNPPEFYAFTCGARTRAGTPCKMRNFRARGRCRLHGGLSTGPKTEAGRRQSAENGRKGGRPRKRAKT
jgi:hypothetical protein